MEKEKKSLNSLSFLLPLRLIKEKHFSKKDVRNIKDNLVSSFSNIYLIVSLILIVLLSSLAVYMMYQSNNDFVGHFGLGGLIGVIVIVVSSIISASLIIIAKKIKSKKTSILLSHIAGDLLLSSAAIYMLCCIYADAEMGYTSITEAISPGVVFIAILVLVQPMYWRDAIIIDITTSLAIVGVSIYCKNAFGMQSIHYYGLTALIYPFACYLVVALLFYAESQRYKEIMENERLHNNAYYDSLTHCKNRHALNEYVKENTEAWKNVDNINLLMVLFDIDDFRLYNNQFSHLGGDYCLKALCDTIRQEFKSPNLDFFRYGGEEFLLFFELKDKEEAVEYLERIRLAVSKLDIDAPEGAPKKNVTISVGGLLLNNVHNFEFEKQLKQVDDYLYQAKASGKDVVCYNGSIIK